MSKSGTSKLKVLPQVIVAERVMATRERGGFSQGEARRNYLAGGVMDHGHIGRVDEGITHKGEGGGTGPSLATRTMWTRQGSNGTAPVAPVSEDDVLTGAELRGEATPAGKPIDCTKQKAINYPASGPLYRTRDGRVVRTTYMEDKQLPSPLAAYRRSTPAPRGESYPEARALLASKGVKSPNPRQLQAALDYLAAIDAGLLKVRG